MNSEFYKRFNEKKGLTLCSLLLLMGCVTDSAKLAPEFSQLTGWIDMAEPLPGPVQVTVSILALREGQFLPWVKSHYQISSLPLKYDFRQLPRGRDGELFMRAELRWLDNPAVQARNQMPVALMTSEKIMLIPLPCFPDCQSTQRKK